MAIDPICHMTVDEQSAIQAQRDGETFYFCSEGCRDSFLRGDEPGSHSCCHSLPIIELGDAARGPASLPESDAAYLCPMCPGVEQEEPGTCWKCGMALEPNPRRMPRVRTVYQCPMHPEVEQDEPGTCPLCGMALEARTRLGDESPDPELLNMQRRFRVALVLTVPVFALAMLPMAGVPVTDWLGHRLSGWLQMLLSLPVVFWAGFPFLQRGIQSITTRNLNMFTLIMIGVLAAFGFSMVGLLAADMIPESLKDHGQPPLYFEAAAVITTLVLLGQILELTARRRTGDAIRSLMSLTPPTAMRIEGGTETEVPIDRLSQGDVLRVKPGARIPVDGLVLDGTGAVDESMLTGESANVAKKPGDAVIGGTINQSGSFTMRADRLGENTVLAGIVQMVAEAQLSRAPIQSVADRVARWFVPAVVLAAVSTWLFWAVVKPLEPAFVYAFVNAVAVLIIACPCALGLATPMSITVGVGRGARAGVLVRNAAVLEQMARVDTVIVDKTGTLTAGRPTVTEILPEPAFDRQTLLNRAASVERSSEHPIATAIVQAVEAETRLDKAEDFESRTGLGVTAVVAGQRVHVGCERFLDESQITISARARERAAAWRSAGATVVLVAIDGQMAGLLAVSDPIKESAPAAIERLHGLGLKVIMLTGDQSETAQHVAQALSIDEVHSGMQPADKTRFVRDQRREGRHVAMAGDGINDAPALAEADVGIAMGSGTDIAMQAADITLVKGDLSGISRARELSLGVMRNIRQNLFFAFAYNMLGIPIAAGILVPFDILLNPMLAAAAMSLSSVSVIANALRLRSMQLD